MLSSPTRRCLKAGALLGEEKLDSSNKSLPLESVLHQNIPVLMTTIEPNQHHFFIY